LPVIIPTKSNGKGRPEVAEECILPDLTLSTRIAKFSFLFTTITYHVIYS